MSEETHAVPSTSNTKTWVVVILVVFTGVLIFVALLGVGVNAYVKKYNQMVQNAKRSELSYNVNLIQVAQLEYHQKYGRYVECSAYPPFLQKGTQSWNAAESGGFQILDWKPDGEVRGSYRVSVSEDDFTVMGISDIDADGVYATYVATKSQQTTQPTTPPDVY